MKFKTIIQDKKNIAISIIASSIILGHQSYTHTIPYIYRMNTHSVVTVNSIGTKMNPYDIHGDRIQVKIGIGSGFVFPLQKVPEVTDYNMSKKLKIVTNYHVIEDAENIKVQFDTDNKEFVFDAKVIQADSMKDIAVLEINIDDNFEKPKPIFACNDEPQIGDDVITIGNPFGFVKSVSSGIVSGIHRKIPSISLNTELIQTDAAINSGNSGGPLISVKNNCILGMNTALVSQNGSFSGVGFSIPIKAILHNDMINKNNIKSHPIIIE